MRSALPEVLETFSGKSALGNRNALHAYSGTGNRVSLAKGLVCSSSLAPDVIVEIHALSGAFWITLEGNPNDYVLQTGETLTFKGPGLLVAEGLSEINEMEQDVLVSDELDHQS